MGLYMLITLLLQIPKAKFKYLLPFPNFYLATTAATALLLASLLHLQSTLHPLSHQRLLNHLLHTPTTSPAATTLSPDISALRLQLL